LVHLSVTRVPASGIHVDVTELDYGRGFQRSLRTARGLVAGDSGAGGYYVEPTVPDAWQYLSGESGGLPAALGFVALRTDCRLNGSVAATGRLDEDGSIERVRRLGAKVDAAVTTGRATLLVPPGQRRTRGEIETVPVANVSAAVEYGLVDPSGGPCDRTLPLGD
jgi:hypothetical protein